MLSIVRWLSMADNRFSRLETYLDYAIGIMAAGVIFIGLLGMVVAIFTSINVVAIFEMVVKQTFINPLSESGGGATLIITAAVIYGIAAGIYALW